MSAPLAARGRHNRSATSSSQGRKTTLVVALLCLLCGVLGLVYVLKIKADKAPAQSGPLSPEHLRIVNYFPAATGWGQMWSRYSHDTIDADFAAIKSLGASTVRLIVQPYDVGYPKVLPAGANGVDDAIATASKNGLYVQLTLFDGWGTYADLSGAKMWLQSLLQTHVDDQRIALIEIQNELNMDNAEALQWAKQMLTELKTMTPKIPRTISVRNSDQADVATKMIEIFGSSAIDVIDVHLYGNLTSISATMAAVRSKAENRPVMFGETGLPTASPATVGTEEAQAQFYRSVWALCLRYGFAVPAPWMLNDLTQPAVAGHRAEEANYGLRRLDGTWKPAATVVRQMFAETSQSTVAMNDRGPTGLAKESAVSVDRLGIDGVFAKTDLVPTAGRLGAWFVNEPTKVQSVGVKPGAGPKTGRAAFLGETGGDARGVPSVAIALPIINPNAIKVSVYARLEGKATGLTQVAIAWFGANGYLGQTVSTAADNKVAIWQKLTVTGTPPAGATVFQIHLKSANNSGTAYFGGVELK